MDIGFDVSSDFESDNGCVNVKKAIREVKKVV